MYTDKTTPTQSKRQNSQTPIQSKGAGNRGLTLEDGRQTTQQQSHLIQMMGDTTSSKAVLQGKFKINSTSYTKENKDTIPDISDVKNAVKELPHADSIVSILVSNAGAETSFGSHPSWENYIETVQDSTEKDVSQFDLAAKQILDRYDPEKCAYIALGSSPDPIAFRIKQLDNNAVVLPLPLSNIDNYNLSNILKFMDATSESDVAKTFLDDDEEEAEEAEEAEEEEEVEPDQKYMDNRGGKDYIDNVRVPYHQAQIVKYHLDQFVPKNSLDGRKHVLLMDYVDSGRSLKYAGKLLDAYYGGSIRVTPFAFGTPNLVNKNAFEYAKKVGGVEPEHLSNVFETTTYKEGHRVFSKFDVIKVFKEIKNIKDTDEYGKAHLADEVEELPQIDFRNFYKKPERNKKAIQNFTILFDTLLKEKKTKSIDTSDLSWDEAGLLIEKMAQEYGDKVDDTHKQTLDFRDRLLSGKEKKDGPDEDAE